MKWYILYTRHHHERAVHERVLARGFQAYLPLTMIWRKSYRSPRKVPTPLFPRHVFVRCYLEMYAHLELISIPGVMQILEDTQGRLSVVPEAEIQLLRRLCNADISIERVGYHPRGRLVEVVQGHLRGICGIVQDEMNTTLLVPIHTLQTSVAVEIDGAQLRPYVGATERGLRPFPPGSTERGDQPPSWPRREGCG
jgi:transcription antitermination factor NusG